MDDNKAAVTISFDFEIGWGDITNDRWRAREASGVYDRLRTALPRLLRELDLLEIPCTWATVGAMFAPTADRQLDHIPDQLRQYICTQIAAAKESTFSGEDLFEMLLSARAPHDVACHSYSHIPWDDDRIDEQFVAHELALFNDALSNYSRATDRIVFPENKDAFHDVVAGAGFRVCRGNPILRYRSRNEYLRRILFDPPPLVVEKPTVQDLRTHHASMLFNSGPKKLHRLPALTRRVSLGLNAAMRQRGTLHIWSHPFNFAESTGLLSSFLRSLKKVADYRDRGLIVVRPM